MAYTTFKLHKSESSACALPEGSNETPPKRLALRGLLLTRLLAQLPPNWIAYIKQVAGLLWRGVENSLLLGASAGPNRSTLATFVQNNCLHVRSLFVL